MAELIYNVTEIAKLVGVTHAKSENSSAVKMNLIMRDLGIQTKVDGRWKPTEEYKEYAVLCETNYNNYYKWKDGMVIVIIKGLGKIVSQSY